MSNEHPPLNAPAGSSGFTAAVSDQPGEWPHTITLEADHFVNGERQRVLKEYRWRFEEISLLLGQRSQASAERYVHATGVAGRAAASKVGARRGRAA